MRILIYAKKFMAGLIPHGAMGSVSDSIGNQQLAPAASRSMQSKTKALRQTLLATAAKFFAGMGYDSISLATIEAAAKAPKNVIPYHFGSKANLWREAANFIFQPIQAKVDALAAHADAPVDAKQIVETFVEISAAHPEVAQLIFQEAKAQSWRLEYLVSHQSKPLLAAIEKASGQRVSPHQYYFLVGAGSAPFTARYECLALFGVDPQERSFIDLHTSTLKRLIDGASS